MAGTLLVAVLSPSAHATVFTGSRTDPADRRSDPARDVKRISMSFDNATGSWKTELEFYGPARHSTIAKAYLGLAEGAFGTCTGNAGPSARLDIGRVMRGAGYAQFCVPSTGAVSIRRSVSADKRLVRLTVVDPGLVGSTPLSATPTRISQNNVYFDRVPAFRLTPRPR